MTKINGTALEAIQRLRAYKFSAYLVGGCVRDMLLGLEPKDWDIATSAEPADLLNIFYGAQVVGAKFGVVLWHGIEIATFRREGEYTDHRRPDEVVFTHSVLEDSLRRDFRMNAMYFDPGLNRVLDFHQGQKDLHDQVISTVGRPEHRLKEDFLRMLRAVRFAGRFRFALASDLERVIQEYAPLVLGTIALERIRDEFSRMLTQGNVDWSLRLLKETRLLKELLPELDRMEGVQQPPEYHPEGDVWQHTLLVAKQIPKGEELDVALAAVLHDMGKPATHSVDENGRHRFNEHDLVGAGLAWSFLHLLKYSNETCTKVHWLINNHMRVYRLDEMKVSKACRLVYHEYFPALEKVAAYDSLGSLQKNPLPGILLARPELAKAKEQQNLPKPFITGDDLIALGNKPGPAFKLFLNKMMDMQLEGKITDRAHALEILQLLHETVALFHPLCNQPSTASSSTATSSPS